MKISQGVKEGGIVVGNAYDKYGARNPIVRWIMKGFDGALSDLVNKANPGTIHEVGCGEGYWVLSWNRQEIKARGTDFSEKVICMARENAQSQGISPNVFEARSIYNIESERDDADLVVCCEVLEHLEDPEAGLAALQRVATSYIVLSVPREPTWCALNLVRGKYIRSLGNTPGHIQHWSKAGFVKLVNRYFEVVEVKTPLPWTMVLARAKR